MQLIFLEGNGSLGHLCGSLVLSLHDGLQLCAEQGIRISVFVHPQLLVCSNYVPPLLYLSYSIVQKLMCVCEPKISVANVLDSCTRENCRGQQVKCLCVFSEFCSSSMFNSEDMSGTVSASCVSFHHCVSFMKKKHPICTLNKEQSELLVSFN